MESKGTQFFPSLGAPSPIMTACFNFLRVWIILICRSIENGSESLFSWLSKLAMKASLSFSSNCHR